MDIETANIEFSEIDSKKEKLTQKIIDELCPVKIGKLLGTSTPGENINVDNINLVDIFHDHLRFRCEGRIQHSCNRDVVFVTVKESQS